MKIQVTYSEMKFVYLLNITSIAAVNRLNLFKSHHRQPAVYGLSDRSSAGRSVLPRFEELTRKLMNQTCSIKTCSKCRQIKTKRCLRILNMPDCCTTRLGLFLF